MASALWDLQLLSATELISTAVVCYINVYKKNTARGKLYSHVTILKSKIQYE